MSWSRSANRRLLWSILNASSQPSLAHSLPSRLSPRFLTTSASRGNNGGNTFSFGPEGDSAIAELASRQDHDDGSREPATTKPRVKKARSLRKKEVIAADHSEMVDGERSTHVDTPRPYTGTPQGQDRIGDALEHVVSVQPQVEESLSSIALDEALEMHGRRESRQSDRSKKQRGDKRHGQRNERSQPLVGKTARDKPLGSGKKTRNSAKPPSPHRGSPKTSTGSEAQPKVEREPRKDLPYWAVQKQALGAKFGDEGWNPRRKLSPDAMLGIRNMHQSDPRTYTTPVLAAQFKVSAESIRRILKSKWLANSGADKMQERRERWAKRHDQIWDQQVALGLRPPRKGAMRVRDAAEGAEEVEEELWAKETLEKARAENPLFR